MKVLLLTTDAYGSDGGIALYNRDLAEALVALPKVTEVVVVPRNLAHQPGAVPANIRFVPQAAGGKARFVRTVIDISRGRFELLICGHINLLPLAATVAWTKGIPLVAMVYGIDVWQQPSRFVRLWLKRADAVWSISTITRERMQTWAAIDSDKFSILPNAIHLDRYGMGTARADLVARYGLHGRTVLLTLGRLSAAERYKGVDEVLEALPALISHTPSLMYLVAGDGDDRQRLAEKTQRLQLQEHVTFVGFVPEQEKADYYRLADVFVMPGRGEGFGFVFLEALACGVPVVGSQLDGSREALLHGELGELADPRDPASIRSAIIRSLAKPKQIPTALSHFAWPAFVDRLTQAAQKIQSRIVY